MSGNGGLLSADSYSENPDLKDYAIEVLPAAQEPEDGLLNFVSANEGLASLDKNSRDGLTLGENTVNAETEADFAIKTSENFQGGLKIFEEKSIPAFVNVLSQSILTQINGATPEERRQNFLRALDILDMPSQSTGNLNLGESLSASDILKYVRNTAALDILKSNLLGSSKEEKLALLDKLEDLTKKISVVFSGSDSSGSSIEALAPFAELLAGADGYLNFGDQTRILPAVPALVVEIADQKIRDGMQSGMAQIPAKIDQSLLERRGGRFLYRAYHNQTILPFPLLKNKIHSEVNQKVNSQIDSQLSTAYAQKWAAVQSAGNQSAEIFNQLMHKLGVQSYYVDSVSETNYIDYERPLNSMDLRNFASALKIDLNNSGASGANPSSKFNLDQIDFLMPDGIPMREILRLVSLQKAGQNPIPKDIMFRFNKLGQLVILKKRALCQCEPTANKESCQISFKIANERNFDSSLGYYFDRRIPSQCSDIVCQELLFETNRAVSLPKACGGVYSYKNKITAFAYNQNTGVLENDNSNFNRDAPVVKISPTPTPTLAPTPLQPVISSCACEFNGTTCTLRTSDNRFLASMQTASFAECTANCRILKSVHLSSNPGDQSCK